MVVIDPDQNGKQIIGLVKPGKNYDKIKRHTIRNGFDDNQTYFRFIRSES